MHTIKNTPRPTLISPNGGEQRKTLELRYICRPGTEAACGGLHIARLEGRDCYAFAAETITIRDFMRVHGYAGLRALLEPGFERKNAELVFVSARYPRMLMRYLARQRKYIIKHAALGAYSVEGDLFPIRVIVGEQRECSAISLWEGASKTVLSGA